MYLDNFFKLKNKFFLWLNSRENFRKYSGKNFLQKNDTILMCNSLSLSICVWWYLIHIDYYHIEISCFFARRFIYDANHKYTLLYVLWMWINFVFLSFVVFVFLWISFFDSIRFDHQWWYKLIGGKMNELMNDVHNNNNNVDIE